MDLAEKMVSKNVGFLEHFLSIFVGHKATFLTDQLGLGNYDDPISCLVGNICGP